jgi:hypothetical protein
MRINRVDSRRMQRGYPRGLGVRDEPAFLTIPGEKNMKRTVMVVSGAFCLLLATVSTPAAEIYVAPDGNDANPGTKESPLATLNRARDAVRELKATAKTPVDVILRGGVYRLAEPLLLGPEDSGTAECPISYTAYRGEKPVISGGRVITGWKRGPGELWIAEIPEVKQGRWYFRQLHVNGQRRPRTRLPKDGWHAIAAMGGDRRSFKFHSGDIDPKWHNFDDVEIVDVVQGWTEARLRIESVDTAADIVRFTGDTYRPTYPNSVWYVENVFEGLTTPGQWYLDRKLGVLYYWPLAGENVEQLEFIAPVAKHWVRLVGDYKTGKLVEHVTFRGLSFQHTAWELDKKLGYSYPQNSIELTPGKRLWVGWYRDEGFSTPQSQVVVPAGIYAKGAHHLRFEDNEFTHTGAWAIHLAQGGCKDDCIVGNSMHDLGAGAVRVGGPDATDDDVEESGRATITDNRIHNCAQVYFGAPAIQVGQSSGNRIAHNEVTGDCTWAISVGWTWGYMPPNNARDNIVEYNHCHHLDNHGTHYTHAALYFVGVQPGTACRHNLLHDVANGAAGISLDNSAVGIVVEHNVIHHMGAEGLNFNFNDTGNIVQNNIVAFAGRALVNRSGDEGPSLDQTGVFYRNIFCYDGNRGLLLWPEKWKNYTIIMDCNLYYDVSGKPPKFLDFDFKQWNAKGLDQNSIIADPLFVDPKRGDFTLRPNSPAFKLGFRPIDISKVGIRPPAARK